MTSMSSRRSGGLLAALGIAAAIAFAACGSGTPTSAPATIAANVQAATAATTPVATAAPTAASTAAVLAGPTFTAVPTSIDPCQLFTAQQASQLTGVSFGAGKETTSSGNGRVCTYGAQTLNVFNVDVAVAPDVATAQAARAAAQADLQKTSPDLRVTIVSGLGDNAAVAEGSMSFGGKTLSVSGVYVLKGRIFFSLNDVAAGSPAAPSTAALQSAAQGILGQLP